MKRILLLASLLVLVLGLAAAPAAAWVSVPDWWYGETGWQTYTSAPLAAGQYKFGIVSSNTIDQYGSPVLLVTGLTLGGTLITNGDFASSNLTGTGYNPQGDVVVTSGSYLSQAAVYGFGGHEYKASDVGYTSMARIGPSQDWFGNDYYDAVYNPTGPGANPNNVSTASIHGNLIASQKGTITATTGSYLETALLTVMTSGEEFSFKWAFMSSDSNPYEDFALTYRYKPSDETFSTTEMAQMDGSPPVPVPGSVLLLGSGLLGLVGIRLRRMRK